ncbi:TPA: LPS export ABC transporter periplasmic protein LptC [Candidatus Poribacteria bacterium]|nr:LPS export ABC transporter periplasmic protein LptC [Candidatus Poribacteria bacterium]
MMIKLKGIINIIIFLIISSFFIGCGKDSDNQNNPPPTGVEQELGSFLLTRLQKGQIRWKLEAKSASIMESGFTKIDDVRLIIFGDNPSKNIDIHSDKGEVNQSTYDVKMIGNVHGKLSDGGYLTTDEVFWSEDNKTLFTLPGVKVKIVYRDSTIIGEELNAKPNYEIVEMKNVIGITKKMEEKQ